MHLHVGTWDFPPSEAVCCIWERLTYKHWWPFRKRHHCHWALHGCRAGSRAELWVGVGFLPLLTPDHGRGQESTSISWVTTLCTNLIFRPLHFSTARNYSQKCSGSQNKQGRYFQWAFNLLLILQRQFCPQGTAASDCVAEPASLQWVFAVISLWWANLCMSWHLPLWTASFPSPMMGKTNSTLNQKPACRANMIWICFRAQGFGSLRAHLSTNCK